MEAVGEGMIEVRVLEATPVVRDGKGEKRASPLANSNIDGRLTAGCL